MAVHHDLIMPWIPSPQPVPRMSLKLKWWIFGHGWNLTSHLPTLGKLDTALNWHPVGTHSLLGRQGLSLVGSHPSVASDFFLWGEHANYFSSLKVFIIKLIKLEIVFFSITPRHLYSAVYHDLQVFITIAVDQFHHCNYTIQEQNYI